MVSLLTQQPIEELRKEADNITQVLSSVFTSFQISSVQVDSKVGGGSLPEEKIPSAGISIFAENHLLRKFEEHLRNGNPLSLEGLKSQN